MDKLLACLAADYPQLTFSAGKAYFWSPTNNEVVYKAGDNDSDSDSTAMFSLLHETGHGLLAHKRYRLDFELLQLEVAAWERAKIIAEKYRIVIDDEHIQDCLDSYRDWLYRRSICPTCTSKALQLDEGPVYRCFNCHASWRVATSRFCRPYRLSRQAVPLS